MGVLSAARDVVFGARVLGRIAFGEAADIVQGTKNSGWGAVAKATAVLADRLPPELKGPESTSSRALMVANHFARVAVLRNKGVVVDPEVRISPEVDLDRIEAGVSLLGNTIIRGRDTYIAGGSTVTGSIVTDSILGKGTVLENGVNVKQSVLAPIVTVLRGDKARAEAIMGKHASNVKYDVRVISEEEVEIVEYTVLQNNVTVEDSVLYGTWGQQGAHFRKQTISIRGNVHKASETKAALLEVLSPALSVELPHNDYIGDAFVTSIMTGRDGMPDWDTPKYYEWIEEAVAALRFGQIQEVRFEEIVEGKDIFPILHVTVMYKGKTQTYALKGVNFGANTTTSNFTGHYAGGMKSPTLVYGGAITGIKAGFQSPTVLSSGSLLASYAKASGLPVPEGSIDLRAPIAGKGTVLEGYLIASKGRLPAEGLAEDIAIRQTYVRELIVRYRVIAGAIKQGRHSVVTLAALEKEKDLLRKQITGGLEWIEKILDLIPYSIRCEQEDIDAGKDAAKHTGRKETLEQFPVDEKRRFIAEIRGQLG